MYLFFVQVVGKINKKCKKVLHFKCIKVYIKMICKKFNKNESISILYEIKVKIIK